MAVNLSSKRRKMLYENRFCSQEAFDIIISGNHNYIVNTEVRSTFRLSYPEFKEFETLYSSKEYTNTDRTVCDRTTIWNLCSNGILYTQNNTIIKDSLIDSYKIYFDKNDQWIKSIQVPHSAVYYSTYSFMKDFYVFGGFDWYKQRSLNRCLKYDTTTSKWTLITNMNSYRQLPGRTVYEGKIVVTGGYHNGELKSVESFDQHENKWSCLPDMIDERYKHGSVSMGNKMFVIGGWGNLTCEVFDSSSRKFTCIKQLLVVKNLSYYPSSVVSIGYKVLFFYSISCNANNKFQVYDVIKDQWCLKENNLIEGKRHICCSKLPLV